MLVLRLLSQDFACLVENQPFPLLSGSSKGLPLFINVGWDDVQLERSMFMFQFKFLKFVPVFSSSNSSATEKVRLDGSKSYRDVTFADLKTIVTSFPDEMPYKKELLDLFSYTDSYSCWAPLRCFSDKVLSALFQLIDMINQQNAYIRELLDTIDKERVQQEVHIRELSESIAKKHDAEYQALDQERLRLLERCRQLETLVLDMEKDHDLFINFQDAQLAYNLNVNEIRTLKCQLGFSVEDDSGCDSEPESESDSEPGSVVSSPVEDENGSDRDVAVLKDVVENSSSAADDLDFLDESLHDSPVDSSVGSLDNLSIDPSKLDEVPF